MFYWEKDIYTIFYIHGRNYANSDITKETEIVESRCTIEKVWSNCIEVECLELSVGFPRNTLELS